MPSGRKGWLPQVLGVVFLLLAVEKASGLIRGSADQTFEYVFGIPLEGPLAWMASALLSILLAWISAGCFRRRREIIWAVAGYAVYLGASYWVFLALYSVHSQQTNLISGAFFSGAALAFCRYLLDRREQFDQG
jgi:hypothetical protein